MNVWANKMRPLTWRVKRSKKNIVDNGGAKSHDYFIITGKARFFMIPALQSFSTLSPFTFLFFSPTGSRLRQSVHKEFKS